VKLVALLQGVVNVCDSIVVMTLYMSCIRCGFNCTACIVAGIFNLLSVSCSRHLNEMAVVRFSCVITACCISDVPCQQEGRNFDPKQFPHFCFNQSF